MYCKEGQTLARMSSFTQHLRIFTFPPAPRKQWSSHYFHTISLICQKAPHNSIYISRKLKSKLNSNFRFIWGKQTKKKIKLGVSILVMTLCRPKEKWPPRIGSLNLFKNPKMFLTKMHYILHAALNKCQGHVAYHMLPPFKVRYSVHKAGCSQQLQKNSTIYHQQRTKIEFTLSAA